MIQKLVVLAQSFSNSDNEPTPGIAEGQSSYTSDLVELLRRYSNTPPLPTIGQTTSVRLSPVAPRVHNVHKRLGTDAIARLVADYEAGQPTTKLMSTYGLAKGTVLRLLREHGATIRHQSLTPGQLQEAIQLYQQGWSLAKVGAHFGRDASLIHTNLTRAGIPRRDSHGRVR